MLTVRRFSVCIRRFEQFLACNPAVTICNLFGSGDHDALPLLNDLHKLGCLHERVHRAGVQPGVATAEQLHVERAVLEVHAVEVGDFQLAARRGLDLLCKLDYALVVEIETGDSVVRLWLLRLFFNRNHVAICIEFYDAEAFRVVDVVAEHSRLTVLRRVCRRFQAFAQACAVENIVAEHHRARLVSDELLTERERLRQTVRGRLHLVGEVHTVAAAVTEKPLEIWQVRRRRNNQNITNSRQHER